ncbi:MAG: hypothetical protein ACREKE_02555 [bacterium]
MERLSAAGLDYPARVKTLRGLYYGSRHSLDYEKCHSVLRNLGFNLYLRGRPSGDPARLLGAELVRRLKDSTEIPHEGSFVDVGHVFVGLEARLSLPARRLNVLGQGGTGLELATWIGDLGGAAGLLAVARMDAPALRALDLLFSPDFYDLTTNLEGDLAGYLVARDPFAGSRLSSPERTICPTVPDALERYLTGWPSDWSQRHLLFVRMIGGDCHGTHISNRDVLRRKVQAKLTAFASFYLVYRLRHLGRLSGSAVKEAARHVRGASAEIAEIFLGLLEQGLAQGRVEALTLPNPEPSPAGPSNALLKVLGLAGVMAPS